jgi:hypothetical protein
MAGVKPNTTKVTCLMLSSKRLAHCIARRRDVLLQLRAVTLSLSFSEHMQPPRRQRSRGACKHASRHVARVSGERGEE